MADIVLQAVPPSPVGPTDAAVAVRASSEEGDSACLVLGNELVLKVVDVRTERPLNHGAYIRSCKISADGDSTEYQCPDKRRYVRSSRRLEEYQGYSSETGWQKTQFYKYVGSSLKRLGYYEGDDWPDQYPVLKDSILKFYGEMTSETTDQSVDINTIVEELDLLIEEATGGRDHVPPDGSGEIRIALPEFVKSGTVTVRLEFHDIKFITSEDMDAMKHLAPGVSESGGVLPGLVCGRVLYDRAAAAWTTPGARDPDIAEYESEEEFSNWYLHCGAPPVHPIEETAPDRVPFRNFVEFSINLNPDDRTLVRRTIYAMTWAPLVWHESKSFRRKGFGLTEENFIGPVEVRAGPASNSLHALNGASRENYSIFGLFRTSNEYKRLHTGIDITGCYDNGQAGSSIRTPVFAVTGGRYISSYPTLHHANAAFTRYVHIFAGDRFLKPDQWAKAGTLVGRIGRSGIDAKWPTHVHFETLAYRFTGWTGPSSAARWDELIDGNAKISAAGYPYNPAIHTPRTDGKPQYIKYQYGTWVRDPGQSLERWVVEQLGPVGWRQYADDMPASYPGYQMPPCNCEFGTGHSNNPSGCSAKCVKDDGSLDTNQVKWAKSCWAIRSSRSPSRCVCPGINERGLDESFSKKQLVQYHLWRLGHLTGAFDGALGSGSRKSIEYALSELGDNSIFANKVAAKEKDFANSANPTRSAIKKLLEDESELDQLLAELSALADERYGV